MLSSWILLLPFEQLISSWYNYIAYTSKLFLLNGSVETTPEINRAVYMRTAGVGRLAYI